MSKIKAKDLLRLGFVKEKNIPSSPRDIEYHYFVYETKEKKGLLISCSNDEKVDGGYEVELYDIPEIQFRRLEDLKKLIKILKRATK